MMKSKFKILGIAAVAGLALAAALIPAVNAFAAHVVALVGPENLGALSLIGSTATTVVAGDSYTGKKPLNTQPRENRIEEIAIPIAFPAAAPVANDIHLLCKLLPGVKVVDWTIRLDDLDTNGSPTCSLSLGEVNAALSDVTTVYKSGITIGQTGGLLRDVAASAAADVRTIGLATVDTERVIGLKWDTASATYAASKTGLLTLKLSY